MNKMEEPKIEIIHFYEFDITTASGGEKEMLLERMSVIKCLVIVFNIKKVSKYYWQNTKNVL